MLFRDYQKGSTEKNLNIYHKSDTPYFQNQVSQIALQSVLHGTQNVHKKARMEHLSLFVYIKGIVVFLWSHKYYMIPVFKYLSKNMLHKTVYQID